jgi:uncharacterized protein YjiS (DUF1127 family)
MTNRIDTSQAANLLPTMPAPAQSLTRLMLSVNLWRSRHRSRAALARLDAHHLRDIGLSATAARRETQKPFWRD